MTFNDLKAAPTEPTGNIDQLIIHMAFMARASRKEYGLTTEQCMKLYDRFDKICTAYPDVRTRVLEINDNNLEQFWVTPNDTVLKYLHNAGILADSIGV